MATKFSRALEGDIAILHDTLKITLAVVMAGLMTSEKHACATFFAAVGEQAHKWSVHCVLCRRLDIDAHMRCDWVHVC